MIINKAIVLFGLLNVYKNPLLPLLDHFSLIGSRQVIVRLRNGLRFKVRTGTNDIKIINELFIHKVYSELIDNEEFSSYRVGIDLGANIGVFSVLAASKMKGRIFSFEPLPDNFELLKQNISLNGQDERVLAISKAVSSKMGESFIFQGNGKDTGGGSLYTNDIASVRVKTKVETITLPDVFNLYNLSEIDFLKVNCEGAEYELFYATPEEYLRKIRSIIIEYHTHTHPDWESRKGKLITYLQHAGFRVKDLPDKILLYAHR